MESSKLLNVERLYNFTRVLARTKSEIDVDLVHRFSFCVFYFFDGRLYLLFHLVDSCLKVCDKLLLLLVCLDRSLDPGLCLVAEFLVRVLLIPLLSMIDT